MTYAAPASVVECVAPLAELAPVDEYVAPIPEVTYAAPASVVEYVAPLIEVSSVEPAPVDEYVALLTEVTFAAPGGRAAVEVTGGYEAHAGD